MDFEPDKSKNPDDAFNPGVQDLHALAQEPLCAELAEHVCEGPLGPRIAHKFVHTLTTVPAGQYNRMLAIKTQEAGEAFVSGNWLRYVFLHERPYRVEALMEVREFAPEEAFAKLCADVWTDSENIHQFLGEWRLLFEETDGKLWMSEADTDAFNQIVEEVADEFGRLKVYRGECNDGGWSWTLKRETAEFFATRKVNESTGQISEAYVHVRHVFAYLDSHEEAEILVTHPCYVTNKHTEDV